MKYIQLSALVMSVLITISCDDATVSRSGALPSDTIDMSVSESKSSDQMVIDEMPDDLAGLDPVDMDVDMASASACSGVMALGCPCDRGDQCGSGLCELSRGGRVCSAYCDRDGGGCDQPGFQCDEVTSGESEPYSLCLPFTAQCAPCLSSGECDAGYGACLELGESSFCASPCGVDDLCPAGSACAEVDDYGMTKRVCIPLDDACDSCGGACLEGERCVDGACEPEGCGDEVNACGGCGELPGEVGAACGGCEDGVFACGGADALTCEGASTLDADDDGTPDACDQCAVGSDADDVDRDGIPDACDCDQTRCSPRATCESSTSGVNCTCVEGYEGDGYTCNFDECSVNNGGCDPLSACTNTESGRVCGPCPEDYDGDGETGCLAPGPSCSETCAEATALPLNVSATVGSGRANDYSTYQGMCAAGEGGSIALPGSECVYSIEIPPQSYIEVVLSNLSSDLQMVLLDACGEVSDESSPGSVDGCHSMSRGLVNYVNDSDAPRTVYLKIEATGDSVERGIIVYAGALADWVVWRGAYCGGADRYLAQDLAAEQLWQRFNDLTSARSVPGGTWNANGRRNLLDGYWNPDGVSCGASPHRGHGEESIIPYLLGPNLEVNISISQIYRRNQGQALGFVIEEDCSEEGVQTRCIGTFNETEDFLLQNTSDVAKTYYLIIDAANDREWTEGALDTLVVRAIP